mgnify:CR=1 FL=1
MKVWKVDNYCVGDVRLCRDELQDGSFGPEYWRTPQMDLEDILNALINIAEDFIMFNYKNDKRPKFDGDMSLKKLTSWIESHLNYPQELKKEGIQGRVTIIFTITKEGELTDVKVLRGVHPMLDEEAIRVIKTTAGKWTGGCNAFTGEPQDSQITCPVIFRLKP